MSEQVRIGELIKEMRDNAYGIKKSFEELVEIAGEENAKKELEGIIDYLQELIAEGKRELGV